MAKSLCIINEKQCLASSSDNPLIWNTPSTFAKKNMEESHYVNVVRYAIWYHLYNLKNVKNTYGEMFLLVKLQPLACNFT